MAFRKWKFALIIVVLWCGIVAYMGLSDLLGAEVNGDKLRTKDLLTKSQLFVKKLKNDIMVLKERIAILERGCGNAKSSVNQKVEGLYKSTEGVKDETKSKQITPSLALEVTRRRASKELREMWYYLSAEITKINRGVNEKTKKRLTQMLDNFAEVHRALDNNMEKINNEEQLAMWRDKEHESLSELVQNRLHRLQNPADCQTAKKLVCELNKGCGYGCQVHHLLYCFLTAYGSKRTLIIDSKNWRYSPAKGWEGVFQPVSKSCPDANGPVENWSMGTDGHTNVLLPIVDSVYPKPKHLPLAVPADLAERLKRFHKFPFGWWIGQFAKYLFRYNPEVEKEVNEKKEKLGFKYPIVGVHVRRTDKINLEADYHRLEEYMYWVDLYYKKLSMKQKLDQKRVYLASDDASVLPEAKKTYPSYEFISDNEISKSAGLNERYSDKSLHGVIFDIQMLSECDYLVCTFSSQVCRVAYEIMQARSTDASDNFQSLDDVYYFGGQSVNDVQAIYPYKAKNAGEIDLEPNDRLQIAGNHWDGYSKATSRINHRTGLFPSYLVEKYVHVVEFPDYSEFDIDKAD